MLIQRQCSPLLAAIPRHLPHPLALVPSPSRQFVRAADWKGSMLGAIKRALGVGTAEACAGCDPAILAACEAAEAGSVTPHNAHVFIKLAAPAGSNPAATDEAWWPESVDK